MNKKEFIIPIVSIIVLVLIGVLLVVNSKTENTGQGTATTTATSTASTSGAMGTASSGAHTSGSTGSGTSVGSGTTSFYPYGSLTLAFNQVAGFKDGLSIRPTAILEDSRCPQGVQCIQAGTVRITLRTGVSGTTSSVEADLNKPVTVGGDTVTLTAAAPVPTKDTVRPSDSAYRFTFTVEPNTSAVTPTAACHVGGCSSQLCTDAPDAISTCEYSPSYGCYKTATCERQATGQCGWTQTAALSACLANPPSAS